jgi:DNA-binding response OmpR family regulator
VKAILPLKVLLIDDYEDAADSYAVLFQLWGHKPIVAKDGRDGLIKASVLHPDLVLADVSMPGTSGLDFAKEFRKLPHHSQTPLVAITGMQGFRVRCLQAGYSHFFLKPVDLDELRRIVEEVRSKVAVDLST